MSDPDRHGPLAGIAIAFALGIFAMTTETTASDDGKYAEARRALVHEIERHVRETSAYLGKDRLDSRVIQAIGRVPRHEFVPEQLRTMAYMDRALPIDHGQTISQPYIVAIMSDLLAISPGGNVLEVGTGSGYQAAVLGELGAEVYTIEIVEPLGLEAKALLDRLGYENVHVKIGDGFAGWPEHAPYDAVIVTAAAPEVPPPLLEQLKPGGRMIIPVNSGTGAQDLVLIEKTRDGDTVRSSILPVLFVPLTRDENNGGPASAPPSR